jgi:hypothetical protein
MCEGYSIAAAVRHAGLLAVMCAAVISAGAQGGGGRSDSVRLPASEDNDRRSGRSAKRPPLRSAQDSAPKVELPQMGRVSVHLNGGGSVLQLFRAGLPTPEEHIAVRFRSPQICRTQK